MHEYIMNAIEKTLKDWGVDWKLGETDAEFRGLMIELELALSKVID